MGDERRENAEHALTMPTFATATYTFANSAALDAYHRGEIAHAEYGRYGNPTRAAAERELAALEGGGGGREEKRNHGGTKTRRSEEKKRSDMKEGSGAEAGVDTGAVADAEAGAGAGAARDVAACLFASGMAAITTTLWAMLARGKHIILTSDGYRRTRQFVTEFLARFGVESTIVPPADLAAIEAAIRPETRVLFTESPTNPYLRVVDVPALAAIARARRSGLKLVIDATLATPINQRPLEQGADLVIHSATKYLGGHNDLLAGVVIGREPLVNAIRDAEAVLGGIPSPETCERLLRGVKTLGLRVAAQNHTALAIARSLEEHDGVSRVFYPGLVSHPDHLVAKRIMTGFGGVVSFIVRGDARRVVDSVKLARIAPSLGGVDTLIEQPAFMSYHDRTPEERAALGIPDNLIRLSVGVESTDTLIADLNQALERR